jgi:hypothetical protein
LVESFELEESSKGPDSFFSPRGKLGLMFLKNYSQVSDKKLIEQLNSNIDYQFFCDMNLGFNHLENYKIVSQIRCEVAENLNIEKLEKATNNVIHKKLESLKGKGGLISIDKDGNISMPFNTAGMFRAQINTDGKVKVEMYK